MKKIALLLFLSSSGWAVTCPSGYLYYRTATINHSQAGSSDSSNFTILLSTQISSFATAANSGRLQNANGYDLIITTATDGSAYILGFETETYKATNGLINYWAKVPTVSHTVDTVLYTYYDNSSISTFQGGSVGSAWDANYLNVYHFPNGTTLSVNDSTSHGNNGTIGGSGVTATTGEIDGAVNFNQTHDITGTGASVSGGPFTLEQWFNLGTTGSVFFDGIGTVAAQDQAIQFGTAGGAQYLFWSGFSDDNDVFVGQLSTGTWYFAAATMNSSKGWIVYFNATNEGSGTFATQPTPNGNWIVGGQGTVGADMNGSIDEVRISSVARSADWITTEYNNQSPASTMITWGSETACASAPPATGGTFPMMGI